MLDGSWRRDDARGRADHAGPARPALLWGIVALGVALRAWLILHRPWLWLDEAHLAPTIRTRDWAGLFAPAGNDQMAPIGYMLFAKLSVTLFGPGEVALRLPALIAGIAALALFVPVTRLLRLPPRVAIGVVAVAAILPAYIRYSAELKQYSLELCVALLALVLALTARERPGLRGRAPLLALGFPAVFLALSAPFALAGVTIPLLVRDLRRRDWTTLLVTAAVAAAWCAAFALHYLTVHDAATDGKFSAWWAEDFAPHSAGIATWAINHYTGTFEFLTGSVAIKAAAAVLSVIGAVVLGRRQGWAVPAMLLLPLALAMLGAVAHAYPFTGRLILYGTPGLVVTSVAGAGALLGLLTGEVAAAAIAAGLVFVAAPIVTRGLGETFAHRDEPLPEVMAHVAAARRPGDAIYVHALALPVWRVYRDRWPALSDAMGPVLAGADKRVGLGYFMRDLDRLQGHKRVWLVMARGETDGALDGTLARYFGALEGRVIETFERGASSAMLVDFSAPPARAGRLAPRDLPPYAPFHASYGLNP